MSDESIAPKRFIVKRDGTTDLILTGWVLAKDTDGWPEVRLYKSQTGRYIVDWRELDEAGELVRKVEILPGLDELVSYIVKRLGEFSEPTKRIFRAASGIEPSLQKYAVEEV